MNMKTFIHWLFQTSHETILEENYMGSSWSRCKCVICGKITNAWDTLKVENYTKTKNIVLDN